jgi:hypothetical protein
MRGDSYSPVARATKHTLRCSGGKKQGVNCGDTTTPTRSLDKEGNRARESVTVNPNKVG